MPDEPEDNFARAAPRTHISGDLSDLSSNFVFLNSQAKRIPAARRPPFPHFHSDDYYYGLYPYFKTG
jgi:hypothetical protein